MFTPPASVHNVQRLVALPVIHQPSIPPTGAPFPPDPPYLFIYNFSKRRKSDVRRKKRKKRTKTISENTQETFKTLKRKPKCLHKTPLGSQKTSKITPKRSQLCPKCRTTRRESEEDKRRSSSNADQQEENQKKTSEGRVQVQINKKTLSLLGAVSPTADNVQRVEALPVSADQQEHTVSTGTAVFDTEKNVQRV